MRTYSLRATLGALAVLVTMPAPAAELPLETVIIETPGLPPVHVFVGPRDAAEAALRAETARVAAMAAAPKVAAMADPQLALPDYPAKAPVIAMIPPPAAATSAVPVPAVAVPALAFDYAAALRQAAAKPAEFAHPRLTRAQREEIIAFYVARDFQPLWIAPEGLAARTGPVRAILSAAAEDGLDQAAYAVAVPAADADAGAWAAFEFRLSQAAVLYARDAQGGRIDAKRLSDLIDPAVALAAPAAILSAIAGSGAPEGLLSSYNPSHAGYRALRAQLVQLRLAQASGDASSGNRIVSDSSRPDSAPQARRTRTAALAVAGSRGEADIIANMERWRWLPRELGDKHVFVNIPEYRVRVMERGAVAHEARAIVGKPESQTPVFSDRMQFLLVNPSWFVPPSILKKEFLPRLATDPEYAARRGYQVTRRGNQITVRQPPGERNALGHIKFMFPNRHAVYLHDTPTRGLFGRDQRALSHGCVRVDQPFRLAEFVLGTDEGWTEQKVRNLVGRGEQSVRLATPLPVHLAYFTLTVDGMGRLESHEDIYGHNRRVKAALGLE